MRLWVEPIVSARRDSIVMERDCRNPTTALMRVSGACMVGEDPPHGARGHGEEVHPILPRNVRVGHAQKRLVDQGSRLQRVARAFTGHLLRGDSAQFLIDQGRESLQRVIVA